MKSIEELESLWLEHRNLMVLLPVLKDPYPEVLKSIDDQSHIDEALLTELVLYSLTFPSRHWALSAVSWLENGFKITPEICEKLLQISNDKSDTQMLRHKSFAQARRWQRKNGI